jgi:hypothetical protein
MSSLPGVSFGSDTDPGLLQITPISVQPRRESPPRSLSDIEMFDNA